jgi:DNA-binding transcriptional regulator YiaG
MKISDALVAATRKAGLSPVQVAALVSVSESTVTRWLSGATTPRAEQFMMLRKGVPGFADLMDGKVAA